MWTIVFKELTYLLKNPIGYVFAGLLMLVVNWMYFYDFFVIGQADLTAYWTTMIFLFSIFIPAISMGLISEEKKNGNWELLHCLPIRDADIVSGKFFGALIYLMGVICLSIPTVIIVLSLGKLDLGVVFCQMLAVFFIGSSYLATGIWFSGLTNQPIIAFLMTTVTLVINNLIGQLAIVNRLPEWFQDVVRQISLSSRVESLISGLIRVEDIIFFISWFLVFIILTVVSVKGSEK